MNTDFQDNPLVSELLENPLAFKERGRAYQLLQEYFAGLPVSTLRPLLHHDDNLVKHAAVWIASELGDQACDLLDDVIPLMNSGDRFLCYHTLEIAVVCAIGARADRFCVIPQALESRDDVIQGLAMRLLTRAESTQLEAAVHCVDRIPSNKALHKRGLSLLVGYKPPEPSDVARMLQHDEVILRMYGAIAVKRRGMRSPELLQRAAMLTDKSIARFVHEEE